MLDVFGQLSPQLAWIPGCIHRLQGFITQTQIPAETRASRQVYHLLKIFLNPPASGEQQELGAVMFQNIFAEEEETCRKQQQFQTVKETCSIILRLAASSSQAHALCSHLHCLLCIKVSFSSHSPRFCCSLSQCE